MGVASLATSTHVEVRDADDGRLVGRGRAGHPGRLRTGDGTPVEQHVDTWWTGLAEAITAAGGGLDVAGLAVAGQRGALVLVDRTGTPLGPASLAADRRARRVAEELCERLGSDRLARATGQRPDAASPLARLVWRLASEPALADRLDGVLGAADALTARLTGRRVTDRSGASATGWWDPAAEQWHIDLLERVAKPAPVDGWAAALPPVLQPSQAADWVSATVHNLVRLRGRPLVAAGTTDLAAKALAAAVAPGSAAALLDDDGAAVVAGATTPVADPRGTIAGLADATGHHLPTVAIAPVGRMLDAIAHATATDASGLAARAARSAGAASGRPPAVVVLPAVDAVVGLDSETATDELARAALLGAGIEVLGALRALDDVGGGEPEGGALVLAGTVARRPGLASTIAELAGREVAVARHGGAATGACVQAAAALLGTNPLDVARAWSLDAGDVVEPAGTLDAGACLAAHAAARERLRERLGTGSST